MYRIRKSIEFAMAHRLEHHNGLCRNVHGHTYVVEVELDWPYLDSRTGMLADFSHVKAALELHIKDPCDHAMCFSVHDRLMMDMFTRGDDHVRFIRDYMRLNDGEAFSGEGIDDLKIYVIDVPPTAEHLARLWFLQLEKDERIVGLRKCIVHESPTSSATFYHQPD